MTNFCSECNTEITEAEYNYSFDRFHRPLCREHQRPQDNTDNEILNEKIYSNHENSLNKSTISEKESGFIENMIKGRIAETLVEELFTYLGYSVFRYNIVNTVPGVMQLLKGVRSDVASNIKKMPDLVIQDPNSGKVYFTDIKFRKNESFTLDDIGSDYPYENCYFIVISKKHIKCITYQELKEGKGITPSSRNYLGNRKEFELDKDVIIKFCDFAVKFFDAV
ncbi:hypothetical protein [uncultured Methanomethylovorans sp.]|uniref:hypothetical protein n=1 Tax=uncultured Methanomethylovorans sp. TaxID=183759 RepID=UPI002AA66EFA|nr:hypothetical protein [uncultured Methanomethylovorans sp.]